MRDGETLGQVGPAWRAARPTGSYVGALWRYPVKSMAGERLQYAELRAGGGIAGDRLVHAADDAGAILSARTRPGLLGLAARLDEGTEPLVDGLPWNHPEIDRRVRSAAGDDVTLVRSEGPRRFDILPLLVATDGAIAAFAEDGRRLRPNLVVANVAGLAERGWAGATLRIGQALIGVHGLRSRCIVTTYDPDTLEQRRDVLHGIHRRFAGKLALDCWVIRGGHVAVGTDVEVLGGGPAVPPPSLFGRMAG